MKQRVRFRWAVCQLDALTKCLNLRKLREAMADLPNTLDGTYDRILCAIDKEYSQDAFRILQWLVYSVRPLRTEEVVDVIAVGINDDPRFDLDRRLPDPRDILTICSSLVTMTEEAIEKPFGAIAGEYVRLAHFSVKEYLMSKRIQDGPAAQFGIQEIPANTSIAEICLAYLLQFDNPDSVTGQTFKEFPLARYAARFWTQHAQIAGENQDAMHSLIMELLLSNIHGYINCIRLFDPERPWYEEPDTTSNLMETFSPLYYMSLTGLTVSVRLLLEAGADSNAQGGVYGNALQAASFGGHDQAVQRLLEKGADVNAQGGVFDNALQAASLRGHNQVVQRLLEKGADVNAQGGRYGNALQAASFKSYDQVVQRLLERGADANARGGFGSALQAASYGGNYRVVQRLLEKGADANARGGFGSALQTASYGGHDQVVQWLSLKPRMLDVPQTCFTTEESKPGLTQPDSSNLDEVPRPSVTSSSSDIPSPFQGAYLILHASFADVGM
jgi:ankyrin repeat protein